MNGYLTSENLTKRANDLEQFLSNKNRVIVTLLPLLRRQAKVKTTHYTIQLIYFFFFNSLSGHRPAQRECARTGLRSHERFYPYPIQQPVKVGHTLLFGRHFPAVSLNKSLKIRSTNESRRFSGN